VGDEVGVAVNDFQRALVESTVVAGRIREAVATTDPRIAALALADVLGELATVAVQERFPDNPLAP
jgi:hypothetical protein